MVKLNSEDLKEITGGISFWTSAGIVGIAIFLMGILDGFTRPIKCN